MSIAQLMSRIDRLTDRSGGEDACWPWRGSVSRGKPIICHGVRNLSPRRVLHESLHGALPSWQRVYATCESQTCCNPKHLVSETLEDRLWRNVDRSGGPDACWLWTNKNTLRGYGRIGWCKKRYFAHRLAYQFEVEDIPDDGTEWVVMHVCDNPPCCNPKHLRLGRDADNHADMVAKGRHPVICAAKTRKAELANGASPSGSEAG